VHVRPTVLEDLFGDEREKWDEEDEEGGMKKMTSLFFKGFRRERWKGKVTNNAGARVSEEVYVIGDTVLIHTGAKLDSVGVIVALWETRFRHSPEGDSDDEDGDENEEADTRMKAKVHWFLRPSQLATVRAKRDHAEVNPNCLLIAIFTEEHV
jgi:origin recognition complex subunit 1